MRSLLKADIEQCFAGVVTGNAVYSYDDSIATVCKTKLLFYCNSIAMTLYYYVKFQYALISKQGARHVLALRLNVHVGAAAGEAAGEAAREPTAACRVRQLRFLHIGDG